MFQAMSGPIPVPVRSSSSDLISYRLFHPKFERGMITTGTNRLLVGLSTFALNEEITTLP